MRSSAAPKYGVQGLWVGEIKFDAQKLESDLYIEIVVIGFNATGARISVEDVHGAIGFSPLGMAGVGDIPAAPVSRICHERTKTANIEHLDQIFLVLEQRVPGGLSEMIVEQLNGGGRVQLDLKKFDPLVSPVGRQQDSARLPLWDGVAITRAANRIVTGRVVEGHVNIVAGASITAERRELVRCWRNMLAEAAREVRKRPAEIRLSS